MSNLEIEGVKEINSEGEDLGYVRGRRTCISQHQIENEEDIDHRDEKLFSQKQLENILGQREDALIEQYEQIIAELTQKLKDLEENLLRDDEYNLFQQECAINCVKEAHTCPFNCFKGEEIKNMESIAQVREVSSSTTTSKDLSEIQIRDKNLSTPGTINFVQDKQFKANLFLQKKLENAEKEIEKTKQTSKVKLEALQVKNDELMQQLSHKQDRDDTQGSQVEELSIKLLEIEEQNVIELFKFMIIVQLLLNLSLLFQQKLQKQMRRRNRIILDFIKEQYNLEIQETEEDEEEKFQAFMQEWESLIQKSKSDLINFENDFEAIKKELAIKQRNLSQRESEHDALIQKIAQAEIMLDESQQENTHFNEKLSYETQKRKEIEQNQKCDLLEILQLLEGGEKNEGLSVSELKDSIIFQMRMLQRDCEKMTNHKQNIEKLDEENFQMKLQIQRSASLNNNLEKLRNEYDQLNYKFLQQQEQIMLLEQENKRMIRDKQTSDEIQMENLKSLNNKLVQELASLNETRSRESSDLQEKIEKITNKLQNLRKENEDLKLLIRSRNNTQDNCQEIIEEQTQIEKVIKRLDTIEEASKRGESLDSDRKSSLILSLEEKHLELMDENLRLSNDLQMQILQKQESDSIAEINGWVEEDHKSIFEINNLSQQRKAFLQLYKKLKDDKIYAEQTAIDTKVQLAEMAMSKDYYEHNFIKLLKKVK